MVASRQQDREGGFGGPSTPELAFSRLLSTSCKTDQEELRRPVARTVEPTATSPRVPWPTRHRRDDGGIQQNHRFAAPCSPRSGRSRCPEELDEYGVSALNVPFRASFTVSRWCGARRYATPLSSLSSRARLEGMPTSYTLLQHGPRQDDGAAGSGSPPGSHRERPVSLCGRDRWLGPAASACPRATEAPLSPAPNKNSPAQPSHQAPPAATALHYQDALPACAACNSRPGAAPARSGSSLTVKARSNPRVRQRAESRRPVGAPRVSRAFAASSALVQGPATLSMPRIEGAGRTAPPGGTRVKGAKPRSRIRWGALRRT